MLEQFLPRHLLAQMRQAVRPLVQIRLVNLEYVSGEHYLGAFSGPGDYGLDFVRREVLGLVDDEEHLAQASAPDICQRRDEQLVLLDHGLEVQGFLGTRPELGLDDIQVVHQGLQERTHLALLVTREETYVLVAEGHCRPGEDYLVEIPLLLQGSGTKADEEYSTQNVKVLTDAQNQRLSIALDKNPDFDSVTAGTALNGADGGKAGKR